MGLVKVWMCGIYEKIMRTPEFIQGLSDNQFWILAILAFAIFIVVALGVTLAAIDGLKYLPFRRKK